MFLTPPERDDLTDEMTTELIQSVSTAGQRRYIDRQGFSDPTTLTWWHGGVAWIVEKALQVPKKALQVPKKALQRAFFVSVYMEKTKKKIKS